MRIRRAVHVAMATGLAVVGVAAGGSAARAADDVPTYLDTSHSFEERAADLVSRMTLAEKASQTISSRAPGIPRLGVRPYGWWNEALHGVARLQYNETGNATVLTNTTSYPISQSLGATWDRDLVYRVAREIGDEAREVVPNNTQSLDFWSPTMNLSRDPRWGRNDEAYSEDPLLTSELVGQFVNGMEGNDQSGLLLPEADGYKKTVTTIKHYAANNSEVNRLTGSSDMDDRTLREYYTKAFRDVIRKTQPGSVMSSYNRVNGTPATVDPYLLDTLLRQTFGFKGYVVSDCDAIYEVVRGHRWQPPTWTRPLNNTERHAFAMSAGTDLNCNMGYHDQFSNANTIPDAVGQGIETLTDTFNVNDLDQALVRLFAARMQLGEFDDENAVPWVREARARLPKDTWTNTESNGAVTQTAARLQLVREAGAKSIVLLENDTTTRRDGTSGKLLPLAVPRSGAFKVAVIGQMGNPSPAEMYLGGYSSTQGPAGQANLVSGFAGIKSAVQAVNPGATVEYLRGFTGSGTRAEDLTEVDPAAVSAAAGYDAVIVYAGTDAHTADEAADRPDIHLPGAQSQLIEQVAERNPNTIAYLETIGPVDVTPFAGKTAAILWSSYNGQRKGEALADVLLGTHNPSGRLPSIWHRDESQLPDITNYAIRPSGANPGRTAQYFQGPVAYPFGHGLSYTTFTYSDLVVSDSVDANGAVDVRVRVRNAGERAGQETVQLYATTPDAPASAQRPIKRLVAFDKVQLAPGEGRTVRFSVPVRELAFFDQAQGRWVIDQARYGMQVARSSATADVVLSDDVRVTGTYAPKPAVLSVKPVMEGDRERDVQYRVAFPEGVRIDAQPTVAMSDDTLYGYVRKGASKPIPSGMTFAYESNRPDVVSAGADGLRTTGNGVATVTAKVTYAGVTRSTSFVVRVESKLSGITVGGKALSAYDPGRGFAADVYTYDVVVPEGETGVPQVAATATSPDTVVDVQQAPGVPGTARVVATGADGIRQTYVVHFARRATGDELDGAVGPQWSWVRPDASAVTAGAQGLSIGLRPGTLDGTANSARNVLVQPAVGDWTLATKLTLSGPLAASGQQAGLIAYAGDDEHLRLGWENAGGTPRLSLTVEDAASGAPVTQTLASVATASSFGDARTVWLKLVKRGPRYVAYWSKDGNDYRVLYETGASLENVRVGVYAFSGAAAASDLTATFDWIRVRNGKPAPAGEPPTPAPATPEQPQTASPSGDPVPAAATPAAGPSSPTAPARGESASRGGAARAVRPVVVARTVRVDSRRRATVKVRCPAAKGRSCRGTVAVTIGGRRAGTRTVTVAGGRTATVRITLRRAVLRGATRARVTVLAPATR